MRRLGWILLGYVCWQIARTLVYSAFGGFHFSVGMYWRALIIALTPLPSMSGGLFEPHFTLQLVTRPAFFVAAIILVAEVGRIRSILYYLLLSLLPTVLLF